MNPATGVLAITALLAAFALVVWLACRPRKPKPLVRVELVKKGRA